MVTYTAPSAPRNLAISVSQTAVGTVTLTFDAPTSRGSGITGYRVAATLTNVAGIQGYDYTSEVQQVFYIGPIGTGEGSRRTFALEKFINPTNTWGFVVYAEYKNGNVFAYGPASNKVVGAPKTVPATPQNLTAAASLTIAGRVVLSWVAPTSPGVGSTSLSSYNIYSTTGAKVAQIPGNVTTWSFDGLTPGTTYGYYITASNAIGDNTYDGNAYGIDSLASNSAYATPIGKPPVPLTPSALPSGTIAGRLTLTWAQTGPYTGFNVYETTSGTPVFLATVSTPRYVIDGLSPTARTFQIAARNTTTDSTNPATEGPRTADFSGAPGTTSSSPVAPLPVTDITNNIFNGQYTIVQTTATSMSYVKTNPNIPVLAVTPGVATITDDTLALLNGTYTITDTPTVNTFTYSRVAPDSPPSAIANSTANDLTNAIFNGTYTVTGTDETNKKVTYAVTAGNISARAASGTITNVSNTVYNGSNLVITGITANTIMYSKTNANLAETGGTGTITNLTNRDVYNAMTDAGGAVTVLTTPTYNTFTYAKTHANIPSTILLDPYGVAYRATSKAILDVNYRSGWAG